MEIFRCLIKDANKERDAKKEGDADGSPIQWTGNQSKVSVQYLHIRFLDIMLTFVSLPCHAIQHLIRRQPQWMLTLKGKFYSNQDFSR